MTCDEHLADGPAAAPSAILFEALSREDGKNSTVRVYRDRIEWIKEVSISSRPRAKNDPPVIPMQSVAAVKAKKDGPLFSKVILRTAVGPIVFRMHHPQALALRDAVAAVLAGGPAPYDAGAATAPAAVDMAPGGDDDVSQLEMLRADGMISAEEFEAAKAALGQP